MTNPNPKSPFQNLFRTALAFPLVLLLVSCGSDNSDDSDSATTPGGGTPPGGGTTRCIKTHSGDCLTNAELAAQASRLTTAIKKAVQNVPGGAENWDREQVNAYKGYAHVHLMRGPTAGASPGAGVHIGLIDSGIHLEHPDLSGRGVGRRETFLPEAPDELPFDVSHGTSVASKAVGLTSGIAWGADMTMLAVRGAQPTSIQHVPRKFYQDMFDRGVDIQNHSFGWSPYPDWRRHGFFDNPGAIQQSWTTAQVRNFIGEAKIKTWAQSKVPDKTIMVWSAGNNNKHPINPSFNAHSPSVRPGLPYFIPELRGHWVAVVATDREGNIAGFSNRCGIAAQWCIAAPGERVRLADYNPSTEDPFYAQGDGTSYAAPIVTGGLAVMKQLFRDQLSNTQLVSRLFATAKKSGEHGNRAIYGQGLMDLGAATNPWGTPAFMGAGSSLGNSDGASMATSFISLGSALGDSLPQSLNTQEVAAFDDLGAPFWFEASDFTVPSDGASVATRLNRFLTPPQRPPIPTNWQFNFQEKAAATETGHLALTHGASRFTMAGPQGVAATVFQKSQDLEGLTLSWTPAVLPALTMEAGYLNEHQSLLNSQGSGAFGRLSGQTLFLSAGLDTSLGDWELEAQGEVGQVNPSVSHSQFIDTISPLATSTFRLAASRPFVNGSALRFSLSQPLRVHSGAASLSLPTGRTQEGAVVGTTLSAPLVPSGRQLDLSTQLDVPWLEGDLSLGATRSTQPRHQQSAAPEWTFFTGYRATW